MTVNKNSLHNFLALVALILIHPTYAQAQIVDQRVEGAKLCTRHLQYYEREYGIPAHLLSAIASTESGRYHDGLKIKLPWPWTINAEGRGYFFDTKEEAIAAAHKLYKRGVESMDVGCMQVNLHHHPNAFTSLSQAFEPKDNIAYAANFLRSLYQNEGSWRKAASDYHSKTPNLGSQYVGIVYDSWFKIIDKLRNARLNIPNSSINGLNDIKQAGTNVPATHTSSSPKYITIAKDDNTKFSTYKSPHMKTIKINSQEESTGNGKTRRYDNGIIVIHPEITVTSDNARNNVAVSDKSSAPEPMILADSSPLDIKHSILDAAPSAGNNIASAPTSEAKIIRLDDKLIDRRPANAQIIKKSGPNFIFND